MTRREKIFKVAGVPDDAVIPAGYLEQMVQVVNNIERSTDGEWVDGLDDHDSAARWLDEEWPMTNEQGDPAVMHKVEATVTIALMDAILEKDGKLGGPETAREDLRACWIKILQQVKEEIERSAEREG